MQERSRTSAQELSAHLVYGGAADSDVYVRAIDGFDSTVRQQVVVDLAASIDEDVAGFVHPVRIAIDGITGAGKTTFADELAAAFTATDVDVHRLSMDGYHHPRERRHRRGRTSAVGYYEDAYDLTAFARNVLEPLGQPGAARYRGRIIDLATDEPVDEPTSEISAKGRLVVDGSFLQRDELADQWDVVVWVSTPFAIAEARGAERDAAALGGRAAATRLFRDRYHAASRRYIDEVGPERTANYVVDNGELAAPVVRRGR